MRLIDADALLYRKAIYDDESAILFVQLEDINAAPTVCCEGCIYHPTLPWNDDEFCRDECRCGSVFERKTP